MVNELVPCSQCQRHVRSDEPTCPFCHATLSPGRSCNGRCSGPAPARVAKAALVAAGAALLGPGCFSSVEPPYGAAPHFDAGTQPPPDAGQPTDASADAKDGAK